MDSKETMKQLYQHAVNYNFQTFHQLLLASEAFLPAASLREAYLLRGQMKLYAADGSFLEDLEKAGAQPAPPYACLNDKWQPDTPNRLAVFKNTAGGLARFLEKLGEGEERLDSSLGIAGRGMVWQLRSEIFYFSGRIDEAMAIAERQQYISPVNPTATILAQCTMFRCYLAKGVPDKAQEHMLNMIRLAKTYPECVLTYQSIRRWASATTGWSGDNPRFHTTPQGETTSVLDDRVHTIREGYSRFSPLEEAFVDYGRNNYPRACAMRRYYMEIFNAVFWMETGDSFQAEEHFLRAYRTAVNSGMIMPFVEYGAHLLPLLEHISKSKLECSTEWIDDIASQAEQYEKSLSGYRS